MKTRTIIITILSAIVLTITINSCVSESRAMAEKTGAQLWGENCQRCHNTPEPATYSDEQWEAVGMHMQIRANLTRDEIDKIVDFLQTAN